MKKYAKPCLKGLGLLRMVTHVALSCDAHCAPY